MVIVCFTMHVYCRFCCVNLCVCVFLHLTKRKKSDKSSFLPPQDTVLHVEDVLYSKLHSMNQESEYATKDPSVSTHRILLFFASSFIFLICLYWNITYCFRYCGIMMYSRLWKHKAAMYTVHKSNVAHSWLLHPTVESCSTVRRPMCFFLSLQGEGKHGGLRWPRSDLKWCIAGTTSREQ